MVMSIMKKSMGAMPVLIAIGLTAVAFMQSPVANAEDQVERPFKVSGQICFAPFSDVGVATHFGSFVSVDDEGSGGATGKYIAANGDQIFWVAGAMTSYDPITHIFTGVNYLRGGTGRFVGA